MTAITLLLTLLAVAYIGSMLMGGRGLRGYGLPSGAEYVLLGIALGTYGFSTVKHDTLVAFEPIVAMSAAWLGLVSGIEYGHVGSRRIGTRRLTGGIMLGSITALAAAALVYAVASKFTALGGLELLLVAAGAGIVACETTQHVVRWAVERHGAKGPLCDAVADAAVGDDAVPLLILAGVFVLGPSTPTHMVIPWWVATIATVLLGVVIGGIATILLRVEASAGESWGVLLGAALLGTGIAWRLGWSSLTVLFVMGWSLSKFSRHRVELRAMLERTEHPVMLPTLVLAGVQLRFGDHLEHLIVFAAAIVPRIFTRLAAGSVLKGAARESSGVGGPLGLGLMSTGGLTVVVGLSVALRYPGAVGDLVLATATGVTLLGELLGPVSLRRALLRAGEIVAPAPAANRNAESVS